ncbi:MAG: proline dehydrogenase family protein [Acidobacteria bacterium]|nr:proline dehydrogenase family protein [Acidobacteriota bacterium]
MSLARDLLLAGAQSRFLRETAPKLPFVRRTVARFLPGEEIPDAIAAAKALEAQNMRVVFTRLGENITQAAEADAVAAHYLALFDAMDELQRRPEISVKLTQLGLDLSVAQCMENLSRLIERAGCESIVWIDMESSEYVDVTLELFKRCKRKYPNVGLCLQAYLYRTAKDIEELAPLEPAIRLVKGAYKEPPALAFPKKADVDENFFHLAGRLFRTPKATVVVATHDTALIRRIEKLSAELGRDQRSFCFTMLYGIQRREQLRLAEQGWDSRVLIAYGSYWFPWFMRRLAERPANVWFLVKNLL